MPCAVLKTPKKDKQVHVDKEQHPAEHFICTLFLHFVQAHFNRALFPHKADGGSTRRAEETTIKTKRLKMFFLCLSYLQFHE